MAITLTTTAESALSALQTVPVDEPASRQRIDQLKASIDVLSATTVLDFGNQVEQGMARFADTVLDQVMSKDTGPVHDKLSEIKLVAEGLSVDKLTEKKGFFDRRFFNLKREIAKFSDRFNSARQQIDTIATQLEDQVQGLNYGLTVLDKVFDQNLDRFRDLTLHVEAGREVLTELREQVLPRLEAEAKAAAAAAADQMLLAQKLRDLRAGIDRLDRKVLNVEKSRTIALSMMPTIRQSQQTGITLVEELRMAIAHAIPAWKTSMLVHIEQLRQQHGLETPGAMRDFTNEQMKAMAAQLNRNVELTHEETTRGIADTSALVETMDSLMNTLDKVDRLEADARAARLESRKTLQEAEVAFRQRLIEGSTETGAAGA